MTRNNKYNISTRLLTVIASIMLCLAAGAKKPVIAPSWAWTPLPPLGLHEPATIDTLTLNYAQESVPSIAVSPAYATTGNFGSEGLNMLFMEREMPCDFFFFDALRPYLPFGKPQKFYNTRIPMTLLTYNTGGGKEAAQDRLKTVFSGNINAKAQVGLNLDYIYSKGSYNNQALKNLTWGINGSYIGDRYEMQAYMNHWNSLNKESGGITDDLYITNPAELQGGQTSINPKSIPTRLQAAHSRVRGTELYINNRYKVGYWQEEQINDTTVNRTYIPVSTFVWTLQYNKGWHRFIDTSANDDSYWENTYLTPGGSNDITTYWSLRNTFGVTVIEGFKPWAKAGLAAYLTHEVRRFNQTTDTIRSSKPSETLTPLPDFTVPDRATENLVWVGAQLTKQKGKYLRYEATAELGLIGPAAADIKIDGNVETRFKLLGDTVSLGAYGHFHNVETPYLLKHYRSNHFMWDNDFGKRRSVRLGALLTVPHTRTSINAGVENVQNLVYFNDKAMPVQHDGNIQIVQATLRQDFKAGILNWNNRLTYQTSANSDVLPLPKLAIYSNLYLLFKVAGVLDVQMGIDCDYYTSYRAMAYQPATMTFHNQPDRDLKVGNYPFMNAYFNFKLSKARFYVLFSHVNQGLFGGSNYFSAAHYPLNPRRFQLGVSVDFND